MKTIPQLQLTSAFRFRGTFLAVFAVYFAAGLAATHAAPPSLQPLVHPGKWPTVPGGTAHDVDVKVEDNYALVTDAGGLQVLDVSNPANPQRVGGVANPYTGTVVVSGKPRKYYRVTQP